MVPPSTKPDQAAAAEVARLVLSVDVVVLCAVHGELSVCVGRRHGEPFAGQEGLPGVAVLAEETLQSAARRALVEKAGLEADAVEALHVEQLATFDALFRDPRGRTVSVAYLGLARAEHPLGDDARWRTLRSIPRGSLPFDHEDILHAAAERLRGKVRYTAIASHLVNESFALEELHSCYEAVLGEAIDRSNFRAKLLKVGLIEKVGTDAAAVGRRGGRPRHVYRFKGGDRRPRDFL